MSNISIKKPKTLRACRDLCASRWRLGTRSPVLFFALLQTACASVALTMDVDKPQAPLPISDAQLAWRGPPGVPGLQAAWITGSESNKGLYILRVKLQAGTTIPPHRHADDRWTTVLRGNLWVGFGERFEENNLIKVSEGFAYRVPAQVPHYIVTRQSDVVYQEMGVGPTDTVFAK